MSGGVEKLKQERIETLVQKMQQSAGKKNAVIAETFTRQFFMNVPPDDIEESSVEALFKAALGMWAFIQEAPAPNNSKPILKAYSVLEKDGGWSANHTVFEIINDDMPFLVDSVMGELNRQGFNVRLIIHPVVKAKRDKKGHLIDVYPRTEEKNEGILESWIQVFVNHEPSSERLSAITESLRKILTDVHLAVTDWQPMLAFAKKAGQELASQAMHLKPEERQEAVAFLEWLGADNLTFLGCRDYLFEPLPDNQNVRLRAVPGSGLGILRDETVSLFDGLLKNPGHSPDIGHFMNEPNPLLLTKTNRRSTVHRTTPMDAVFIKIYDPKGNVVGERLIVGLFTSAAYARSVREIPYVRRKVNNVVLRAGFDPRGHNGKALTQILETYPRDELFHTSAADLFKVSIGILHLQERQRTLLFVRRDPFDRFVSCLIYVPRDRYTSELRRRIQGILEKAFNGKAGDHSTYVSESAQARLHTLIHTTPGQIPDVNVKKLERDIIEATRVWSDFLQTALVNSYGDQKGLQLHHRYASSFPVGYKDSISPRTALMDIGYLEAVAAGKSLEINLFQVSGASDSEYRLKLYHDRHPLPLSDVLPMMEYMGLKVLTEIPYEVRPEGHPHSIWIHEFATTIEAPVSLSAIRDNFHQSFLRTWSKDVENDTLNRLILSAGLNWREIVILRAYAKYLRQARFGYTHESIADTLHAHPHIARQLIALFHLLHDPHMPSNEFILAVEDDLKSSLKKVTSLDDDVILRRYINVIRATLRTNFYQVDSEGLPKPYISFKLDSLALDELPLPRPWVEIFVYSPRVEAIHLRGGKVARGGIRWSDRREDFRTEILGLLKAQMVKNTVIVPVGSKGGFVVKRLPPPEAGREHQMAEVVECYKTLMRGMLDITDNLVGGKIVPPSSVKRRDSDDPYLVVAADKGTATFSDIANSISLEYGFWMGDAFASGGSKGYDHKKMGITARGAWEAVKRHFREMDHDTQTQEFSVVGVGDMSGDVFGNGMLQSRHILLKGAFDHRHIFCDPSPDAAISYGERERLFRLPRSSWADYDSSKISKGGGVFERTAKSITLTAEIQSCFGLEKDTVTPSELIRAMLKAKVDLLWFGGIGTFVKASTETHADVGDKANDSCRINGRDIQAKVLAEGANLGATQAGRIEYALQGGRLNTDAIDNSAGVDTSDHEVNIKILLNDLVRRGSMSLEDRDRLLVQMTDDVGRLVLRDNYLQTQVLSLMEATKINSLDSQKRLVHILEKGGVLDRALAGLPTDSEMTDRASSGKGMTRPENAVLLAHAKVNHYDTLLAGSTPDDPFLVDNLRDYFPTDLQEKLGKELLQHRLRREIIATVVINDLNNRAGPAFAVEVAAKTGFGLDEVTRAYWIAREVFGLPKLWESIEQLDLKVSAAIQMHMLLETQKLLHRAVPWFLIHAKHPLNMSTETEAYKKGVASLANSLDKILLPSEQALMEHEEEQLLKAGVPKDLAAQIASLPIMSSALDIIRIGRKFSSTPENTARVYFTLGEMFSLEWLRNQALKVKVDTSWQRQAIYAIVDDIFALQGEITGHVLDMEPPARKSAKDDKLNVWTMDYKTEIERIQTLLGELRAVSGVDLAMLTVAGRQLRELIAD